MKKIFSFIATAFIFFASCTKSDNNNVNPTNAPVQTDGKHINAPVQVGVPQPMR